MQGWRAPAPKTQCRVKAQGIVDCRRQFADIDAAGLGEIALANGAGEWLRCVPDRQREVDLFLGVLLQVRCHRAGPVLQCGEGLVSGHAFDLHEPIEPAAACTAGMAVAA